jgi:hypothetical protein
MLSVVCVAVDDHILSARQVAINGTAAANFIRVTVPAGASSGKISVTNAGGTASSAKALPVP